MSAMILKGAPVAAALAEKSAADAAALTENGIKPTLAILRVGERDDDLSYERGAMKRCAAAGVEVRNVVFPDAVTQQELMAKLEDLNQNESIHGVLILRPLPKHLDEEAVRQALAPEKDVDGITDGSLAGVFSGSGRGFAPCTAQAVVETLQYYSIPLAGKKAVVMGRSLVVGRPAGMLLMQKNATVTICHSRSENVPAITREADILVVAAGKMGAVGAPYLRAGQVVIDVGIHFNEKTQKLCGDVDFAAAEGIVAAVTPVPGGLGAVTTAVLVNHVVEAAKRSLRP